MSEDIEEEFDTAFKFEFKKNIHFGSKLTETVRDIQQQINENAGQESGVVSLKNKTVYEKYVALGYSCINKSLENNLHDPRHLQKALDYFLDAVNHQRESADAYFGLAYLYTLVKNYQKALYFLDITYNISKSDFVLDFVNEIKKARV